jgi:hypothetical protein
MEGRQADIQKEGKKGGKCESVKRDRRTGIKTT